MRRRCCLFVLLLLIAGCSAPRADVDVPYTTERVEGTRVIYDETIWPTDEEGLEWCFCPRGEIFHDGVNIPGAVGDPVMSIADGVVAGVATVDDMQYSSYGNAVLVRHTFDESYVRDGVSQSEYYSLYVHLDSIAVSVGQEVVTGDVVGAIGTTGAAKEGDPHLHFGILLDDDFTNLGRLDGGYINPMNLLPYDDIHGLTAEVVSLDPVGVVVRVPASGLDLNSVSVVYQGEEKLVDFDQGEGLDPERIHNLQYDGVVMSPSRSFIDGNYEIRFTFEEFSDFDSIEVLDVWGSGVRLIRS